MRTMIRSISIAALAIVFVAAANLHAQPRRPLTPRTPEQRQALRDSMQARRKALADARPGQRAQVRRMARRMAVRMNVRSQIRAMTPEQRTALRANMDAARTQRRALADQVQAGKLTREQARTQMQQYRKDHPLGLNLGRKKPGE